MCTQANPEYTYDYFQQDDVCRLCWNRTQTEPIHSKTDLLDKITDCLNIVLTPHMPNNACNDCCTQIDKFYNFKKFCQDTDKKLQEIINNYYLKTDNKDEICDDYVHANIEARSKCKYESQQTLTYCNVCMIECHTVDKFKRHNIQNHGSNNGNENHKIDEETADDYIHNNGNGKSKWKYKPKRTPTYCNVCMIDYQTIDKFNNHNILNHGIENGLFKCFGCDKTFKNRKARFCHEKNFCKGLKDGYKCIICDRFLPQRRVFESHLRDHRKNVPIKLPDEMFQCQKCDKLFKTREDLNSHVEAEHESDRKNYVCESCGRVFTRRDYLNKHKLTHTGDKQHVCPHCDFRTIQRSSLIVHIRKHTGERPYTCSICPQRCVSSSNLRAHLQRHMGLKMHECTICNKKFGYKVSLREHMTSHAPAQHACPHCGAAYSRPRALRRHLAGKHGEK